MPSDPNRILIVEDDAGLAELLGDSLQRAGLQTDTVGNARECLSWLAGNRADLLIIDYSLPDMTGAALVEELQRGGVRHPFIVTTGRGDEEVAVRLMKLGALDYLVKDARLFASLPGVVARVLKEVATARRLEAAEQALIESEERYRQLVDNAPVPIMVHQDGRFVFVNKAMVALSGVRSPDELIGTPLLDWVHPDDHELVKARSKLVIETGATAPLVEEKLRRRDGSIVEAEVVATPFIHEGRWAVQVVVHDITARKRAQADFKMLFETMLDGFALHEIICDGNGRPVDYRFIAINPAFTRLTGLAAEAVVGRTVMEVLPQTEPFWIETYGKVALTGEPAQFEHYSVAIDKCFEVAAFRTGPGQFAVVFVDETERRKAQDALARNEAELASIYEHAPVMMLLFDRQRQIRRLNRAALEFAGKSAAESGGLRSGDVLGCLHALDDPQGCGFGAHCGSCRLRQIVHAALEDGVTNERIEFKPRMVRGREVVDVTMLASAAPMTVGGEVLALVCLEDVSQRVLAEHRVQEQAALLDVTRDAIVVVDLDGLVTFWNRGAHELYGWTAAEAVGRSMASLVFEPSAEKEATIAWQAIRHQGRWSGELRQRTRAGESIHTLCRGVLMHDAAGEARSMLFTASDITEAKRIEAQYLRAQRIDSLGSLAGGVAHDLNNVFTPIMMSIEMLRAANQAPHDQEIIRLLEESTRRGADIVRQLLLFGRGSDSPRGEVKVNLVIREVRRMMQETFPKNIELSSQAPADLWAVHADQTQMHQVLLNLCVNARDAMPQGGRLAIAAENVQVDEPFASRQLRARPGPHVLLRVTDTGSGIPPEIIEKIFDPFFTTKPLGQGTGLGLASALGIVRSHGGFITVRSQPGVGSEFGVYLPALVTAGTTAAGAAISPVLRGRGELVLVVDDEINIQVMLEMALTRHGYQVARASDGAEAVALVAARRAAVQLVVTDMMMPKADGLSCVRTLRAMRPQLPIVAISGVPGHRAELEKLPPPKVRFLPKPFDVDRLLTIVREALDAGLATGV